MASSLPDGECLTIRRCEMSPIHTLQSRSTPIPTGDEVPALIVSAHQNPGDADAPTDLEIQGYITKPIDFDLLLERVAELTS